MEVNLDNVKNSGSAILRLSDGFIMSSKGDLEGDERSINYLYSILLDSIKSIEKDEPFHRLSVVYSTHNYIVTLGEDNGENYVYIIKSLGQQ